MKSTGMLFSGDMVRAILRGEKTQTRRIIKGIWPEGTEGPFEPAFAPGMGGRTGYFALKVPNLGFVPIKCPFGRQGSQIWVRETWADLRGKGFDGSFGYRASTRPGSDGDEARIAYGVKWKPSIHMPREASRITLEITDVRVERLQDISEEDARAEGMEQFQIKHSTWRTFEEADRREPMRPHTVRDAFWGYWDSLAKPGAEWADNCWVWVISFKRVEKC